MTSQLQPDHPHPWWRRALLPWLTAVLAPLCWWAVIIGRQVLNHGYATPLPQRHFWWPALVDDWWPAVPVVLLMLALLPAAWTLWWRRTGFGRYVLYVGALWLFFGFGYPVFRALRLAEILLLWLLGLGLFRLLLAFLVRLRVLPRLESLLQSTAVRGAFVAAAPVLSIALAGALGWVALTHVPARPVHRSAGPDVLFVVVDAMRADALGRSLGGRSNTPNLDWLAAHGVRFTRAYSPAHLTSVSLPSLFTGLLPAAFQADARRLSSPDVRTMAQAAFEHGYHTAGLYAQTVLVGRNLDRYFLRHRFVSNPLRSRALVTEAIDYLSDRPWTPSFVYLHWIDTHHPYLPRSAFRAPTGIGWTEMWRLNATTPRAGSPEIAKLRALYDACVSQVDAQLGQLLEYLRRRGTLDRTLIIVTADHGEAFLEHGMMRHDGPRYYEENMRVPLLVYYPPGAPAGLTIDRPISGARLFDLVSGVVSGRVSPADFQPFLERLSGEAALSGYGRYYFGYVRGRWKLVSLLADVQLYDLVADPGETRNLAAERQDLVAELQQEVSDLELRERQRFESLTRRPGPELDYGTRQQLKALGYVVE